MSVDGTVLSARRTIKSSVALDLSGRIAVVTGAGRGLGRVEALELAAHGAHVVIVDVAGVDETAAELQALGGSCCRIVGDVADPSTAHEAITAAADCGGLDIVVNNAGIVRDQMCFNVADEDWDAVVAVNLKGTFLFCRESARYWRAQPLAVDTQRVIVNTTSESGLFGNAGQCSYAAAKAGVAALTITLAAELDRFGVRANAIAPRARTAMSEAAFGTLPDDGGDSYDPYGPQWVAQVVAWLASDRANDVTGHVLVVHGCTVELMQGWRSDRVIVMPRGDTVGYLDDGMDDLVTALFPPGSRRRLPRPIGELFVSGGQA